MWLDNCVPQLPFKMLIVRNRYNSPCKLHDGAHPRSLLQVCLVCLYDGGHMSAHPPPVFHSKETWVCRALWSYGVLQPGAPQSRPQGIYGPTLATSQQ